MKGIRDGMQNICPDLHQQTGTVVDTRHVDPPYYLGYDMGYSVNGMQNHHPWSQN